MRCGLSAVDCVADHWCPVMDGRKEPVGWRLRCPCCHTPRALSVTVQGNGVLWNCHRQPACDRQAIRAELVQLLPGCLSGRSHGNRTRSLAAIEALAADKTLTPTALRMAILRELGWSNQKIAAELKLPAVPIIRQCGFSHNVRENRVQIFAHLNRAIRVQIFAQNRMSQSHEMHH